MVIIKSVSAKSISNSRDEKTVLISIKTNVGIFSASSPTGKSTGKYEKKSYRKNLEEDIKTAKKFSDYFSKEVFEKFEDLRRIEDIVDRHLGANSLFALESCALKAMACEKKIEIWEIINPRAKTFPRLIGNCIEGGKHSSSDKKPDFQEFLLIPNSKTVKENFEKNKKNRLKIKEFLKKEDESFKGKVTDENAWMTSLTDKEALDILNKTKLPLGLDVAGSSFFKRKKYCYNNPLFKRTDEEQVGYLNNLIKNFDLFYIEDPFHEEDFEGFAKLLKKFPDRLIVGDDLTVTNYKRFEKAIKMKSVNAIIVKPNQIGSLIEVKEVCKLAKEKNIKIIFSHRSGETDETILADLAFGFSADFFKCGIEGDVREGKIKRLIEIEKSLKK